MARHQSHERGEAILASTLELVAEVGFDSMTMDAIAARANASKATIYRRWPDKYALVLAAMASDAEAGPAESADTGSLRGDLVQHCLDVARVIDGFDGRLLIGMSQAVLNDRELRSALALRTRRRAPRLSPAVVQRAVARSELQRETEPAILTEVATSLILYRMLAGLPIDDLFCGHLVDDILMPALRQAAGNPLADVEPS